MRWINQDRTVPFAVSSPELTAPTRVAALSLVECPQCDGDTTVDVEDPFSIACGGDCGTSYLTITCGLCHGSGRVRESVRERFCRETMYACLTDEDLTRIAALTN